MVCRIAAVEILLKVESICKCMHSSSSSSNVGIKNGGIMVVVNKINITLCEKFLFCSCFKLRNYQYFIHRLFS